MSLRESRVRLTQDHVSGLRLAQNGHRRARPLFQWLLGVPGGG
jgi:hypothetical protein